MRQTDAILNQPVIYGGGVCTYGEMLEDLQRRGTPEQVQAYLQGYERGILTHEKHD
jgi:hypothetical protein